MRVPASYCCDVCKIAKTKTNHWFAAIATKRGLILFGDWDKFTPAELQKALWHACGHEHMIKKISEYGSVQRTPAPAPEVAA